MIPDKTRSERPPAAALRKRILAVLEGDPLTARELSKQLRASAIWRMSSEA